MSNTTTGNMTQYNTAKNWQVALFSLNNTATNLYMFALTFVSYYATGIAGLAVVAISTILTAMRLFDGITDPILGFIMDKLDTRFGKFRPLMIIGNLTMAVSITIMYNVTHLMPDGFQMIFFIAIYAVYIIGYTMQTACTKAAQTVLKNDPKQRPLFTAYDSVYKQIYAAGGQIFIASYLIVKHGDFTLSLFNEFNTIIIVISGIFTLLAVVALWTKDRKEYYGLPSEASEELKFRDYWPILKGNRPLQMLILAASTDKLAGQVMRQAPVVVMFFGILLGDYALSGTISAISIVPSVLIAIIGSMYARKKGLKTTLVRSSWLGAISFGLLIALFLIVDPSVISLENIGLVTIIFLILYLIGNGISLFTPNIVIPMIADVSDYELYNSGWYVPGMLSTIFSFIDKLVSSLAPALVGFVVAFIGYQNEFPQLGDALTTPLFIVTLVLMLGIPVVSWLLTIIAMKFYNLDSNKMEEIQTYISNIKQKAKNEEGSDSTVM